MGPKGHQEHGNPWRTDASLGDPWAWLQDQKRSKCIISQLRGCWMKPYPQRPLPQLSFWTYAFIT